MSEKYEQRWLAGNEQLFRASNAGSLNVDVNYQHDLAFYAYGYRRSAEMLFEAVQEGTYADSQYFALAFLWRQALELMLKALHEDLGRLELIESEECAVSLPSLKGHDLKRLWAAIESRLLKVFPAEPETGWISRAIDQFHQIDPGAEDFRYPTKIKGGSPTLQSLPRIVSFRDLDRDMRSLLNTLDGAAIEIRSRLEYIAEALALDHQQWRCEE